MTNQEAIDILREAEPEIRWTCYPEVYTAAIDMAIEALKDKSRIRCKNCIHFAPVESPKGCGECRLLERIFDGEADYCSYFAGTEGGG